MPIEDSTVDDLLERLTTPYFSEEEITGDTFDAEFGMTMTRRSNNHRLMSMVDDGFWDRIRTDITDLRDQMFPKQMTDGTLDLYARAFNMQREVDEEDNAFRIRVQGELRKRIGGPEPNKILEFVENFLDADPGDVEIFENFDANSDRQTAFFRIVFSTALLEDLGFESPFDDEISQIEDILDRVAGAGVRTKVTLITGSEWDDATYDADDSIYGS